MASTAQSLSLIKLSCETDFTAKTKEFKDVLYHTLELVSGCPKATLESSDIEEFSKGFLVGDSLPERLKKKTIKEAIALLSASTMENCAITTLIKRERKKGVIIGGYLHRITDPDFGIKAGIVTLESECQNSNSIKTLADRLAVHVVSFCPSYISKDNLPSEILKIKGRDQNFLEENVMMDQIFIDSEEEPKTVREIMVKSQYELKGRINIKEFLYVDASS